ncbi:Gfo/Idh/MocA family protein [Cochlodiniinecator piscidefendens]|uniref:Gfo/Idh/MocA family protein n=1 Tax=Cochlodiniinecator piscidefendens TaxID=2715756 RepID=UPI001407C6AC|nr:Gfo/Idh/MocA family oxidoreductase [Cochlodiniinecator piscidefendens]
MTVMRWGVLGAAKFAREHMAPAIHQAKGATLSALATSTAAKASPFQAFCPDLTVYTDYNELLSDPAIDAVYIPLPNHLHIEWAEKALRAGKHVLCEKPIALRAQDIDRLIALRDETGLHVAEAFMIVHHPQWIRVRDMLQFGAIGQLQHVDGVFTYDNRKDTTNIRNKPETGGGSIPDIGVYPYGAIRFATGQEPSTLNADITWANGVDQTARVTGWFGDFSFSALTSMGMFGRQEMNFHGDGGVIRMTAPFNAGVFDQAQIELHQPGKSVQIERFPGVNQYVLQVEAFAAAVAGQREFACPLEFSQGTQRMIDDIFAL